MVEVDFSSINNYKQYIEKMQELDSRFLITIIVKGSSGAYCSSEAIGAQHKWEAKQNQSLIFIKKEGLVECETISNKPLSRTIVLNPDLELYVSSAGNNAGNYGHIIMRGRDYCVNKKGLNIVIVNLVTSRVVDSVNFDTTNSKCPAFRVAAIDPFRYVEEKCGEIERQLLMEVEKNRILMTAITYKLFQSDEEMESLLLKNLPKAKGEKRILQNASMVLFNQIQDVCREHNVQLFVYYGTLLGAVRHGGFVPWDDDIDICMRRVDFDKIFHALVESENLEPLVLFNDERPLYRISFKGYKAPFIDVFLFEYSPVPLGEVWPLHLQKRNEFMAKWAALNKGNGFIPLTEQFKNEVDTVLASVIDEVVYTNDKEEAKSIVFAPSLYQFGHIFNYEDFYPSIVTSFEGVEVEIPNNTQRVLEFLYKDPFSLPEDIFAHRHVDINKELVDNCKQIIQRFG